MKPWLRYAMLGVAGVIVGVGAATWTVQAGALGSGSAIGPWTSGSDFGTADAGMKTRAVVARRGLLALPAREARYYNAAVDDDGATLDAHCTYRITGGALPAKWWSLTMYDTAGYLVRNPANVYSIGNVALSPAEQDRWTIMVAPDRQATHWLPTGGSGDFNLTLRVYLPADRGRGDPPRAILPSITKESCA